MLAISLVACTLFDSNQAVYVRNISSTYLGSVEIAGLQLGTNINGIDFTSFTATERNILWFDYLFEEVGFIVDADENLTTIQGWISSGATFEINGMTFDTLMQITEELGGHHNDYWFDREQSMRAVTYADMQSGVSLTAVYFDFNDELVWVILTYM